MAEGLPDRRRRRSGAGRAGVLVLASALNLIGPAIARGGDGPAPSPAMLPPLPSGSRGLIRAGFEEDADGEPEIHYRGTPAPGSRITLAAAASDDLEATYRWTQIEGPPVAIDDPSRPRIALTVPAGAERLRFLLATRDRQGDRVVKVTIPIGTNPDAASATASESDPSMPRADAGDDQIGLVGRRITLNGSRSRTTSNRAGAFRWLQVEGPKAGRLVAERQYLSFVPTAPGVYRFLLLVASDGVISDPDEVIVTVGEPPAPASASASAPNARGASGLAAGPLADRIAEAFEAIAERAPLYSSFESMTSEMTRRLDAVVPRDPATREFLTQAVFLPLSSRTAAEMQAVGLDLRAPGALQQPLSDPQKEHLRKVFLSYAQEFRSAARPR